MLRPATPLTLLLFVAFVLLLLSVLSTPIVKGIPLASFKGVDFGVFGYCKPNGQCTGIQIGYATGLLARCCPGKIGPLLMHFASRFEYPFR